jgi:amidohydrolase
MTNIISKIKSLASSYKEDVVQIRHHLHMHPELSYQEHKTADFVAEELRKIGIQPKTGVAGTGIVALINGKKDGPVVALRADMDALPITEENEVPYKSTNEGVMHACGHDVHTSCLLGAARILHEIKDDLAGSVKLIFQPGEEKNPGGASIMIKEGALKNPVPGKMFGQHVMPLIPAGKVGFRSGMYMASADEIYLTIKGTGGHAAMPELLDDTVLIASHIIVALQQLVSRKSSPKMPTVLSFGKVEADGATNIIPGEVKIAGTFRTFDEKWRKEAHRLIHRIAEGTAKSMGVKCEVIIDAGYPHLMNDVKLTVDAQEVARQFLGAENVLDLDMWMGAEDFAYYSHEVPACFYRLGTRNEAKGITSYVHTSTFDIDEDALPIGMGLMAFQAYSALNS